MVISVARVAVVGAGVVGACLAYYLASEGADVLLIDAGPPGQLTTSASLAWVNASTKADHEAYFHLCFAGLRQYDRLVADFASADWWNPTGHLRWDYGAEQKLVASVERLQALDYPVEVWEGERVQRLLEPNLALPDRSTLVVRFPTEAWVDGPKMVQALVRSAVKSGAATAFGNAIRRISIANGSVTSLELAGGEKHTVETVVNAAGPGAADVGALVGRALPMKAKPGLAVRVETTRDLLSSVVHAPKISIRPDGAGRAFLSAPSLDPALHGGDPSPIRLAEDVKSLATRVVPDLAAARICDIRIGRRPIPVDGLPVIGKPAGIGGYFEAVTHSGITLGPIIARALTAEILHGEIDPLVSSFRASRFS
jgi:glycine/D-amino acid oxidase-like deaminating enzyme